MPPASTDDTTSSAASPGSKTRGVSHAMNSFESRTRSVIVWRLTLVSMRRRRRDRLHRRALRHLAEPLLHERLGLVVVDVAGNHQAGVVGRVVLLEELHDVVVARRGQVLHVADGGPAVGMGGGPEHLVELDRRHAVGAVLVALTPLVLHHVALPVDALGRHRVEQVGHAIRLEEERQLQRVRRHVDDVVGAVVGRRAVVVAAGRLEQRVELAFLHVLRALEHQVLEEVREAGAAGPLVGRAHVIPDVDGHDGHAGVAVQDHVEPVGELELPVGAPRACEGRFPTGPQERPEAGRRQGRRGPHTAIFLQNPP